jgi:hypothetical protein
MDFNSWNQLGRDYEEGLLLLSRISDNQSLIKSLKNSPTEANRLVLLAELHKANLKNKKKEVLPKPLVEVKPTATAEQPTQADKHWKRELAELPSQLWPVVEHRKNAFNKVCVLKMQLNELSENEEEKALTMQLEMFRLWQEIDMAWAKIDYWKENRRFLPSETVENYEGITLNKAIKERALLYSRVVKRKKTIAMMTEELLHLKEKEKDLRQYQLDKKKEELVVLENSIQTLNKIIQDAN